MSEPIVFLDVDGVLNNESTWPFHDAHRGILTHIGMDRRLVPRLNRLCEATGASLVISSTWRGLYSPEEMHSHLVAAGMNDEVKVIGATNVLKGGRHLEISAWLVAHPETSRFVILDDDCDAADEALRPRFVNTAHGLGLTDGDVARAIGILGESATRGDSV